jgi:hypothetical protein
VILAAGSGSVVTLEGDRPIAQSGDAAFARTEPRPTFREQESELEDAAAHGDGDRFGPVARAQLVDDVLEMGLDRVFRNLKQRRDLPVPMPTCDLRQYGAFALGE